MDNDATAIIITVEAGIILNNPDAQFQRSWQLTKEEIQNEEKVFIAYGHAQEYSRSLWNPKRVNWCRLTWIYL